MAGISGNQGYVLLDASDIAEFTQWDATLDKSVQTYNARSGNGWQTTVIGNKKFSGSFGGKYDPLDPIETHIDTDALVTLELHQNSTNYWRGSARLGQIQYSVNHDSGEVQSWTCPFESHGSWTHTGQ